MVIETITLSLLVGKLRRGRIGNLSNLYINGWYFIVVSFLVEIMALLIATRSQGILSNMVETYFFYIHIFIYLLLIIGLGMNFHEKGFKITFIGAIFNFIPILLNNGRMPVSVKALRFSEQYTKLSLLDQGRILTHSLVDEISGFTILGDIIPISKPYPLPKIISLGDILIALGIFILIQSYMKQKSNIEDKVIDFYRP